MQRQIKELIADALERLDELPDIPAETIHTERTRDRRHGDFATNIALVLAKRVGLPPRDLAGRITAALTPSEAIERVEIAGPGFINFTLTAAARHGIVARILDEAAQFGRNRLGQGRRLLIEFVSANPTGPLHVGHGRGAAYGATVADLLEACGYHVDREYYVNDAGRQMAILACSVWLRYLELQGEVIRFPSNGYRGAYIIDIARDLVERHGTRFQHPATRVMDGLPADAGEAGGDKERHIDALCARCRELLGDEDYGIVFSTAIDAILADIREDLGQFGVQYERWFREQGLLDSGQVEAAIATLDEAGHLYRKDGATWFRSTAFGDEKDRVVVRENGQLTYFATDIAYHADKVARGYDGLIDVWGADHHGYVPRVRAAMRALGLDDERLEILLVQFAVLYRGGEKVQMSTRSGEFVTLRELRDEVGNDAARFFYVMRKCEQHMDFDLDLARSRSNENPVYYVQYAHARVCSVMRQLEERGLQWDEARGLAAIGRLTTAHEEALMTALESYPEVVATAGQAREPHQIAYYLRELATHLHAYYNACQFIVDDEALRDARLALILATRQVLANGLGLLGVSAPSSM